MPFRRFMAVTVMESVSIKGGYVHPEAVAAGSRSTRSRNQVACASPDEECHVTAECEIDLCDPGWPDGGEVMHQCSYDGEAGPTRAPRSRAARG